MVIILEIFIGMVGICDVFWCLFRECYILYNIKYNWINCVLNYILVVNK